MENMGMLLIQAIILGAIVTGVLGFVFIKVVSRSTETHVTRLNRETESVRSKQSELNQKIKEANEELKKRREEADALVSRMKDEASTTAKDEREKMILKARQESEDIIAKAQKTKEAMRKVIEKDMELKAIDFMVIMMGEIFSERVRESLNRDLTMEFLDSLQKIDVSMVNANIGEAEITSPIPLAEDLRNRLDEILQQRLGRKIVLKLQEDPKVLAGIIICFESLKLDGSLANMVKEKGTDMKERLERGLL